MGSDFSALDAQLDALSQAPTVDALALARDYAGELSALNAIDEALAQLESGVIAIAASRSQELEQVSEQTSEQIELPDPVWREPERSHVAFGDEEPAEDSTVNARLPDEARFDAARSGSFSLDEEQSQVTSTALRPENARDITAHDITIEPVDEELLEAELDEDIELTPEAAPLGNVPNALFDLAAPANSEAELEADAAFAALFAEATRQSSMPSASGENEPSEDTEVFAAGSLPFEAALAAPASVSDASARELESDFRDEALDSAEFEIVADVTDERSSGVSPSQRPSRPPEKRPSFLGRLFGRKEE